MSIIIGNPYTHLKKPFSKIYAMFLLSDEQVFAWNPLLLDKQNTEVILIKLEKKTFLFVLFLEILIFLSDAGRFDCYGSRATPMFCNLPEYLRLRLRKE